MKKIMTLALLAIFVSTASFGADKKVVTEGKSFTPMGNFRVQVAEKPVIKDGVELETYTITYDNPGLVVTVAIEKDKNCKRYLTFSDKLSVQYVCHGTYFGIERLTPENSVAGMTMDDASMNKTSYFHQRVISQGYNDMITCMRLIGAYFPELLVKPEA
ncbi:MAG TPA: hypothetical protein VK213_06080 [Bacteroidales bacterium]|nr:hypothetical protein [Bacteroidales bacterium]